METSLPLCPTLKLYLLEEDFPTGRLAQDEMLAIMNAPAYWAFCWASGQVLARHILDHPDTVNGKTVLDFGSGSGVVAVAAAMAGANHVISCDIDPFALDACQANATLNNVSLSLLADLSDLDTRNSPVDLAIAADVLYDRDNMPLLEVLPKLADEVLIADSRVKEDSIQGYERINQMNATTIPDLDEFREFNNVRVYVRTS